MTRNQAEGAMTRTTKRTPNLTHIVQNTAYGGPPK